MAREIRFGDFLREIAVTQHRISFRDLVSQKPGEVQVRAADAYRLLFPYVGVRLADQLRSVLPLAFYLIFFELLILRQWVQDVWIVSAGFASVIAGLVLFMEGLKVGLMPLGETLGLYLPQRSSLPVVLILMGLLGMGVTFAEPAIGALKAAGIFLSQDNSPLLYDLLHQHATKLTLSIGLGVGLAAILGTLRFLYSWSLKAVLTAVLIPLLGLTLYAMTQPGLVSLVGLAWDCGAITTGPVTVPLVLALGIGVASSVGKGNATLAGFGIVTLASLLPVAVVLLLGILMANEPSVAIQNLPDALTTSPWWEISPWAEILASLQAILPLVFFLWILIRWVVRAPLLQPRIRAYGIFLTLIGMILFSLGLTYGLSKLGSQAGGLVPASFLRLPAIATSPLYPPALGIMIAILFAGILGLGATLAEPALNALGATVQNLTHGAFQKRTLMWAIASGVGMGLAIGVMKLLFDWSTGPILVMLYTFALGLTFFSTEEMVNIAWDGAGVTTGPVTVPLVLALGLGLGQALQRPDGFGILAFASIGPVLTVLATGIYLAWREKKRIAHDEREAKETA